MQTLTHAQSAANQFALSCCCCCCCCRYDFDIPILAMDLVAAGGAVTLAIIDACPVSSRLTLPQHYVQTMSELQQNFLPGGHHCNTCCCCCSCSAYVFGVVVSMQDVLPGGRSTIAHAAAVIAVAECRVVGVHSRCSWACCQSSMQHRSFSPTNLALLLVRTYCPCLHLGVSHTLD
jgi:hypothetical protein